MLLTTVLHFVIHSVRTQVPILSIKLFFIISFNISTVFFNTNMKALSTESTIKTDMYCLFQQMCSNCVGTCSTKSNPTYGIFKATYFILIFNFYEPAVITALHIHTTSEMEHV